MSSPRNQPTFGDTPSLDAFGRLRASNLFGLHQNKNIYTKEGNWEEEVSGAGAAITFLSDEAAVELTVGTVSGEYAIRQSRNYFPYIPGKSQQIMMTGVLGNSKENVVRRMGYYDDNDGLFFEVNGNGFSVVVRSSTSGSSVDTVINEADFNIEKPNMDLSKAQIFFIDFQWLGVGRVRFGCVIDGVLNYFHEMLNANNVDTVYIAMPSLPVRYELRNTGTAASLSTLKEICSSVASEGGFELQGNDYGASNGITTVSASSRRPVFALKLINQFKGKDNRITAERFTSEVYATTNNAFIELEHIHAPSGTNGNFSGVHPNSVMSFSTDISIVSGDPISHPVGQSFVIAGGGSKGPSATPIDIPLQGRHGSLHQNKNSDNSEIYVFYATPFTGTTNVSIASNWIEYV
jgi:hypothetical protein